MRGLTHRTSHLFFWKVLKWPWSPLKKIGIIGPGICLKLLFPNLRKQFRKEVSQIADYKIPFAMESGGLSVNLKLWWKYFLWRTHFSFPTIYHVDSPPPPPPKISSLSIELKFLAFTYHRTSNWKSNTVSCEKCHQSFQNSLSVSKENIMKKSKCDQFLTTGSLCV